MQAFTSGDVTVRVEISNMQPHVGHMTGYYCEFVWWLEIDGVEYVSGETTSTEVWSTSNADGSEGWDAEAVAGSVDDHLLGAVTIDDIDAVVEQVLDWFSQLREDIVGAWGKIVNEYVAHANEYGDGRTDRNQYAAEYRAKLVGVDVLSGAPAWCIVDGNGEPLEFGDWYDSKELAVRAISIMQHV